MPWEAVYKAKCALKGRQNLRPGGLLGRDADRQRRRIPSLIIAV